MKKSKESRESERGRERSRIAKITGENIGNRTRTIIIYEPFQRCMIIQKYLLWKSIICATY